MKKSLKASLCAYCGTKLATTEDHVIARGFLPVPLRGNLPKVPACAACNNIKSEYERYATTVFPFGSMHPAGDEILRTQVANRLANDQRLLRHLRQCRGRAVGVSPDGTTTTTSTLPLDAEKVSELFRMVIRGLLWHHCGSPLPESYTLRVFFFTERGIGIFREHILSLGRKQLRNVSIADGAFAYQFTRKPDDPFFTAWILDFFYSLNQCGVSDDGRLLRVYTAALSGPPEVADAIESLGVQPKDTAESLCSGRINPAVATYH